MSFCSIHNTARVVDVRQVIPHDSLNISNEPVPGIQSFDVANPTMSLESSAETLNKVGVLFVSFFMQLVSLLSDNKGKATPAVPLPRPDVTPRVVPEPETLRLDSAANIPGLSTKRNGAKPDNIWSGFRQGPDGNCVTVSAIKAAMYRFGQSPTDIYRDVRKVDDGYRVVMRDDFQLALSDRELAEGARGAKFVGKDVEMLKDAQFLFAVSAKRAQMENNDRTAGRHFSAAIRSLNNGEDESGPGEGFRRLGLRSHMKRVSVRDLARGQLGMCNRSGHSVAVINGREEMWGRQGRAPTHGDAVALV